MDCSRHNGLTVPLDVFRRGAGKTFGHFKRQNRPCADNAGLLLTLAFACSAGIDLKVSLAMV